ncbi:hypothetical protein LZ32DRAFT_655368 [Colletotrichum eremochloae]|nr:hypothetical protein LZ32DRAFT_655368 [Colletotrichum eremochloae]
MLSKTNIRDHQGEVLQLRMQLVEYEVENAKLKTSITDVEKRAEAAERHQAKVQQFYQRKISELEAHIKHLDGQNRGLKSQAVSYEAEKSKNKTIANSRKVSDDAIKASWRTMAYNIESLVANILTGRPSRHDLNNHGHEDKEETCAFCRMNTREVLLLQNDDMRASVVEKLVWDAVTGRVLSHDTFEFGKIWAGVPGQSLSNLFGELIFMDEIRADPSKFLRWKAESSAMIDKLLGTHGQDLDKAVYEEIRGLRKFVPRDCPNIRTVRSKLSQELRKIFKEALEIHRIIMQSQAHFYLDKVDTEDVVHYNPEGHTAEAWDNELSEKSIVVLGISPSLVKVGNADGGNYDKSNRLVKASVICN